MKLSERLSVNNRPLVFAAAGVAIGVALGRPLAAGPFVLLLIPVIAALAFAAIKGFYARIFIVLIGLCAGLLRVGIANALAPQAEPPTVEYTLRGRIVELPYRSDTNLYMVVETFDFEGKRARVRLSVYDPEQTLAPNHFQEIAAKTALELPVGARNPGGYDQRAQLLAQGIGYVASAKPKDVTLGGIAAKTPYALALDLRLAAEQSLDKNFAPESAALIKGILLGTKAGIDEDVYEAFRITGVTHLLSVSGLHVGFFVLALNFVLKRARAKVRFCVIVGFLLVYAAMTGFCAPIVRAGIMALMALGADMCARRYDSLSALAAAALVIIMVSPYQLFTAGFILSFAAMLGISLLNRPISNSLRRLPRPVRSAVSVSLSAQMGTAGVLCSLFGYVPLLAALANLVIVPLSAPLVISGFLAAVFGATPLAAPFVFACEILLDVTIGLTGLFARIPLGGVTLAAPTGVTLCVLAAGIFALSPYLITTPKMRRVALAGLGAAFAISVVLGRLPYHGLRVNVLDVGQGDAIHISANGQNFLLDGGDNRGGFDTGKATVLPYLRHMGVSALDAIILSHADADHIGGLLSVIEQMPVGAVYHGPLTQDDLFNQIVQSAAQKSIPVIELKKGDVLGVGGARLGVLRAQKTGEESLGLLLTQDDFAMLLTGDMDTAGEEQLFPLGHVNVLKVGHHGSATSTSDKLLRFTAPTVAVISVGRRNSYGHPNETVLRRLEECGAQIYRTDESGAIMIDAVSGEIRTMIE